jgi:cyanophycinase
MGRWILVLALASCEQEAVADASREEISRRAVPVPEAVLVPEAVAEQEPEPEPEDEPDPVPPPEPMTLPLPGTVYAHGGGPLGNDHIKEFVKICGGKKARLVVIPTAVDKADDPDYAERVRTAWAKRGVEQAIMLHTGDRAEADSRAFVEPLTTADCVWLGGGAQGRLVDRYVGTRVQRALHAVVRRGGAVGGYSAGMAVLTKVMIRQGNPDPVEAEGFGLLPGVIVDQHFIKKEREPRLLTMLDRHPDLIGYGIDERTALIVSGKRYRVLGHSVVRRCTKRRGCKDLRPGAAGKFP